MKIAVDAMGGDAAPLNPVNGAVLAAREFDSEIVLVGDETEINRLLAWPRRFVASVSRRFMSPPAFCATAM